MSRVAARIVRGLYFRELGERLPDSHGVAVYVVANFDSTNLQWVNGIRGLNRFAFEGKTVSIHADVFRYAFNTVPGTTANTVWTMLFYGSTPIVCFTPERAAYRGERTLF